jgi:hypothetical protein
MWLTEIGVTLVVEWRCRIQTYGKFSGNGSTISIWSIIIIIIISSSSSSSSIGSGSSSTSVVVVVVVVVVV